MLSSLVAHGLFIKALHLQPAIEWSEDQVNNVSEVTLVTLPKDDAPHQSQIEWWYYNGHLSAESGQTIQFSSYRFFDLERDEPHG